MERILRINQLPIIYLVIASTILGMKIQKAIAGNPLSTCMALAYELALTEEICEGNKQAELEIKLIKPQKTDTLHKLGVVLRRLGYLDRSKIFLLNALERNPGSEEISLSLANLEQQAYQKSISDYKSSDEPTTSLKATRSAIELASSALGKFQTLSKDFSSESKVLAGLNCLSFWSSLEFNIPELKSLYQKNTLGAYKLIQLIQENLFRINEERQLEARLSLAESLLRVSHLNPSFKNLSKTNLIAILKRAETTSDLRSISRAYGILGQLSKQEKPEESLIEFGRAMSAAQSIRADDLAYKWQWESAKLYKQAGNRDKALKLYAASLFSIKQTREKVLQLNPDIQYDFRDKIEPVYREYLGLLFETSNPDLKSAIETNNQIQVAELENYLQCNLLSLSNLSDLSTKKLPDAEIYIIKLPDRYVAIVRKKDGALTHRSIDKNIFDASVKIVKQNMQGDRFDNLEERTYRKVFGGLYQALFAPIESLLPPEGTLVINVDSKIQNIPWSMLYDEKRKQYLIERYSIAYSLGSELTTTQHLGSNGMKTLVGGISESSNESEYMPLPSVLSEANTINSLMNGKILLNKNFNLSALIQEGSNYPFIHLATHGQFSSNPNETYIQGWDEKITLSELARMVKARNKDLELLVLSACETAQGDSRATLGIAGTAVQAGAQSTVASLWLVNDNSQAIFMESFYRALKNGKGKAEALREAQLFLLQKTVYRSPFFWGSAILVGNWD
jgi:CHAT domain-containing protein